MKYSSYFPNPASSDADLKPAPAYLLLKEVLKANHWY
jgi:hypothetical protein